MNDKTSQQRLMVRYLLGELSGDECVEFEDLYLRDSDVFHELASLENELIDQYLLGEVSPAEREQFERSFLANPARRETVETARSLLSYSAAVANAESLTKFGNNITRWYASWPAKVAIAAVFLIMLGGISWLALSNHGMAAKLRKLRQEQATALQGRRSLEQQIESLKADLQRRDNANPQVARLTEDTVPFALEPVTSRGSGETTTLVIPSHVAYVLLRVVLQDDSHSRYSLSIRTVEGSLVWKQNNLEGVSRFGKKELEIVIPSHLLNDGDYLLRASAGGEDIFHTFAGYGFHVTRRAE